MHRLPFASLALLCCALASPLPLPPPAPSPSAPTDAIPEPEDPLAPLLFLVGTWHGEGHGSFGDYEFEARIARRGRWLLSQSDSYLAGTDTLLFEATAVQGVDAQGVVSYAFDPSGEVIVSHGTADEQGAKLEWKSGESWRRSTLTRQADGTIATRFEAWLPPATRDEVLSESVMRLGPRPTRAAPAEPAGEDDAPR